MKFHAVLAVVSLSTLAVAGSNDTIPYINQLYRNSFGTPGKDATYDYIIVGAGTAGNTGMCVRSRRCPSGSNSEP